MDAKAASWLCGTTAAELESAEFDLPLGDEGEDLPPLSPRTGDDEPWGVDDSLLRISAVSLRY